MQGFLLLPPIRAHAKQQAIERTRKKKRKGSSLHLTFPSIIDILTGAHAPLRNPKVRPQGTPE